MLFARRKLVSVQGLWFITTALLGVILARGGRSRLRKLKLHSVQGSLAYVGCSLRRDVAR